VPRLGSIKREDLIRYLKAVGFEGPHSGTKHQFLIKGDLRLRIPNPHQSEISRELLVRILKQAEISRDMWERL
jgi:predicted RNA binding protein YcfA (HicA-like mRNA interferase family)